MAETDKKPSDEKPTLCLVTGKQITAEAIENLYEHLTGKKLTPEESARLRERLQKASHDDPGSNRNRNRD